MTNVKTNILKVKLSEEYSDRLVSGGANPKRSAPTYYFANFFRKLHDKEENLTEGGVQTFMPIRPQVLWGPQLKTSNCPMSFYDLFHHNDKLTLFYTCTV